MDDLKSKYPPDVSFTEEDVDIDKFLAAYTEVKFLELESNESERVAATKQGNNVERYIAFSNQCLIEFNLRCIHKMTDDTENVKCPVASTLDRTIRQDGWKKLEADTLKITPDYDRINWRKPSDANCHIDDEVMFDFADKIGLTPAEIDQLPFYHRPKIH